MALRLRLYPTVSMDQGLPVTTTWFINGTNVTTYTELHTRPRLPCVIEQIWSASAARASSGTSFSALVPDEGDFLDAIVAFPELACQDLASVRPVTIHQFDNRLELGDVEAGISAVEVIFFFVALIFLLVGTMVLRMTLLSSLVELYASWCAFDKLVCSDHKHATKAKSQITGQALVKTSDVASGSDNVNMDTLSPTKDRTPSVDKVRTCGLWVHDYARFFAVNLAIPINCLAWRQTRRVLVLKTRDALSGTIEVVHLILAQAGLSLAVLSYYVVVGTAPLKDFIVLLLSFATSFDAILMLVPLYYIHGVQAGHHRMLTKRILAIKSLPPAQDE